MIISFYLYCSNYFLIFNYHKKSIVHLLTNNTWFLLMRLNIFNFKSWTDDSKFICWTYLMLGIALIVLIKVYLFDVVNCPLYYVKSNNDLMSSNILIKTTIKINIVWNLFSSFISILTIQSSLIHYEEFI